ncbi:MAG: hypothetical protein M1817_002930 [Caeruleum heppii]|nr:MAG: hypothetical protein M1817_002930 [Caeruleum heppii]
MDATAGDSTQPSSQPSLEPPAEVSAPTTPMPRHLGLPQKDQLLPLGSRTSSTRANLASSPPDTVTRDPKYLSPPPPPSSMTPPPSSQGPQKAGSTSPSAVALDGPTVVARTPSPSVVLPSSPPPTVAQSTESYTIPTEDHIIHAQTPELQDLLQQSIAEIKSLRTTAAHYKLQHNLLTIETEEAAKRMTVEQDMIRREVEVLQAADQTQALDKQEGKQASNSNEQLATSSHVSLIDDLKLYCAEMQAQNGLLARRLKKAKKMILQRDGEYSTLADENLRLKKRIKENREHLNRFRRPGGLYDASTPRQSDEPPVTPQSNHLKVPSSARSTHLSGSRNGGEDTFAALLLADQVLSAENASNPSTPSKSRLPKHRHLGHTRGSHSLPSIQTTPHDRRSGAEDKGVLLPPLNTIHVPHHQAEANVDIIREKPRRRQSRDSTISASDIEERAAEGHMGESEEEYNVHESQASQLATNMLRRQSRTDGSVTSTPVSKSSGLLQAKLLGRVSKAGMAASGGGSFGKRKAEQQPQREEMNVKKSRTGEVVGLGIGGLDSPKHH